MINQIATNFHPDVAWQWITGYWQVLTLIIVGYALHFVPDATKRMLRHKAARLPMYAYVVMLVVTVWIVIQFKSADVQPFIYFQF